MSTTTIELTADELAVIDKTPTGPIVTNGTQPFDKSAILTSARKKRTDNDRRIAKLQEQIKANFAEIKTLRAENADDLDPIIKAATPKKGKGA
jgi:hypothetical protein